MAPNMFFMLGVTPGQWWVFTARRTAGPMIVFRCE